MLMNANTPKKKTRRGITAALLLGSLLLSACSVQVKPADTAPATIADVTLAPTEATAAATLAPTTTGTPVEVTSPTDDIPTGETPTEPKEGDVFPAPELAYADQFGVEHTLADYRGKVIFLNFWATWCGPCQVEMPDIQKAYDKYGRNEKDVVILGVASPRSKDNELTYEGTKDEVIAFLQEHEYTYPSLLDESGKSFAEYGIHSIPMTYMIDRDGNIFGLMRGAVTAEQIDRMIQMTLDGEKP